ncbi:uncharacterized protein METZ01_LOCUS302597 [marine metagenome]|uniref:Uncharacterized protein n=1 Tax=marine metagenome TaxID=408172 RepID=A0A382ML80_9ZZZZ
MDWSWLLDFACYSVGLFAVLGPEKG